MEAEAESVTVPCLAQQMHDGTLSAKWAKTERAESLKYEKNKGMPGILLTEDLRLCWDNRESE